MVKKAVCLISGGLDSCVTAHIAKNEGYEIYALTFNYFQRHKREIESAKKITNSSNAKNHIVFNLDLKIFGGSSLVDTSTLPEPAVLYHPARRLSSHTEFLMIQLPNSQRSA